MIRLLRRLPLQIRLLGVFLLPGLLLFSALPIIFLQIQDFQAPVAGSTALGFQTAQVGLIRLYILLAILGSAIASFFFLTFLFSRSVLTPVDDLRTAISSFQLGQQAILLKDENPDELGVLIRELNQFTQQLAQTHQALEDRVNQRTQALAYRVFHLQAAAELARNTTSISDLDSLLDRAVQLLKDRFDLSFAGIFLVDSENQYAILRAGTGSIGRDLKIQGYRISMGEVGLVGSVIASGEARVINNVEDDFNYFKSSHLAETRSQAVLPFKIGDQVIGALDLHSLKMDVFDVGIMAVLQIMADQLTVAIQNAGLFADLQARIAETRMLYQRYAQESWSASRLGEISSGYEYDMIGISPMQEPISAEIWKKLRNGNPVLADVNNRSNGQTRSILYAPLMMYNQLIGVIGLEDTLVNRNWTDEEIAVLQTITNQIALALDNSRLLEETQRRSDHIRLLQEVTSIAASQAQLSGLLNAVVIKLQQEMGLAYCDALWFEPDGISALYVANAFAEPDGDELEIINTRIPVIENPLMQQVVETKLCLDLYDLFNNPLTIQILPMIQKRNLSSMLVVPLLLRGEVNGVLFLSVKDSTRRFSDDEISLLNQISLQISSALEVARSFDQATQRAERQRKISEATQRIRETLDLPTILRTAALELRQVLGVPEVTVRLAQGQLETHDSSGSQPAS